MSFSSILFPVIKNPICKHKKILFNKWKKKKTKKLVFYISALTVERNCKHNNIELRSVFRWSERKTWMKKNLLVNYYDLLDCGSLFFWTLYMVAFFRILISSRKANMILYLWFMFLWFELDNFFINFMNFLQNTSF